MNSHRQLHVEDGAGGGEPHEPAAVPAEEPVDREGDEEEAEELGGREQHPTREDTGDGRRCQRGWAGGCGCPCPFRPYLPENAPNLQPEERNHAERPTSRLDDRARREDRPVRGQPVPVRESSLTA